MAGIPPIGQWAAKQGFKKGYTAVTDYAPGFDAEGGFTKGFADGGGTVVDKVRMPFPTDGLLRPLFSASRTASPTSPSSSCRPASRPRL